MPLHVIAWSARMFGTGTTVYLPFDRNFKPNDAYPRYNRIRLSQVGPRPSWHIFADFPPMEHDNPLYPHFVEVHDNDDSMTFRLTGVSSTAGIESAYGLTPSEIGKHRVRIVLLNREEKQLLSQSGDYYIDVG